MQQPLDYPLEDCADEIDSVPPAPARAPADDTLTYAALLDRYESEEPITDEMIFHACRKMDAAQQFPFAGTEDGSLYSIRRWFRSGN